MMWLEILLIILLVLLNGLFAMSEMAVVTARKVRLRRMAEEGDRRARTALELAQAPDQFLSTVQIGITLIGVLAGAFGGATIAGQLGERLERIPFLRNSGEPLALVIVVLAITYLSLVVGELVPKRLALRNPERAASAVAQLMRALSVLMYPAVRLLTVSTRLVLRVLGIDPSREPPVTEEEIQTLLREGEAAGVFEESERAMMESIFDLNDQTVGAVDTPRTEIEWLDIDDPPEENLRRVLASSHSLFPVARKNLDKVIGVVRSKDLLAQRLDSGSLDLAALIQKPLFVPESLVLSKALASFRETGARMALVVDEYGGLEGLLTPRDIVEEIVGSLDRRQAQAVQRPDGSWLVDGSMAVDEFQERFGLKKLPGEEGDYQTVGGLVLTFLGHIPVAAELFEWEGLRIEVVDMDGNRVDKVLVIPSRRAAEGPPDSRGGP